MITSHSNNVFHEVFVLKNHFHKNCVKIIFVKTFQNFQNNFTVFNLNSHFINKSDLKIVFYKEFNIININIVYVWFNLISHVKKWKIPLVFWKSVHPFFLEITYIFSRVWPVHLGHHRKIPILYPSGMLFLVGKYTIVFF